jgi:peptide/nickel transport system permease protein
MALLDEPLVAPPVVGRSGHRDRQWLRVLGQAARGRRGSIGLGLVTLVLAVALIGPLLAPHSPTAFVTQPFASPSSQFPLGSDYLGRDVLSRLLHGGVVLLWMSGAATLLGIAGGAAAGIGAAYLGGWRDTVIMRAVDVILALPQLVFALLLVSIIGPKLWLIVLAVAISHAPQVARVIRSAALDISRREYVQAAQLQGMRGAKIMSSEILPNLISPLMVEAGLRFTYSMVIISGLAFLGFGQEPPAANWGLMINENRVGLQLNPWAVIAPAAMIILITIGANLFTDAVTRAGIGVDRTPEESLVLEGLEIP